MVSVDLPAPVRRATVKVTAVRTGPAFRSPAEPHPVA